MKGLDLEPFNMQARASAPPTRRTHAAPTAAPPPHGDGAVRYHGGPHPDANHDGSPRTTTPATTGKPRNRGPSAHSPAAEHEAALRSTDHLTHPSPTAAKGLTLRRPPASCPGQGGAASRRDRRVALAQGRATEAFKAQDYEKAVDDLTAAIALDPTNQVFFSNRSVAYTAMQMYEKALEDADECIRLQPTWAKGYSRRAAAKFHLGDLQAAKLASSRRGTLEPTNAKTKADLEHVLSEIAGMRVVLPDRQA